MVKVTGATDRGRVRERNEDRFAGEPLAGDYCYGVVCDGMGGENGGSVASGIACEEVRRLMESSCRSGLDDRSAYMILESAVSTANAVVLAQARQDPDHLRGMGTTLCLALVTGQRCYIANVGDSRAYLCREGELTQQTVDHNRAQMLVELGEITPEEAPTHPDRNLLTRAIGVRERMEASYSQLELMPGDTLLLCSDGLYNMVPQEMLGELTAQAAEQWDCTPLLREANAQGGRDNITAVLLHRERTES